MNNYFKLVGFQRLFQMYDFLKGEGWIFFNEQKIFCREEGYKGQIGEGGCAYRKFQQQKNGGKMKGFFIISPIYIFWNNNISYIYGYF